MKVLCVAGATGTGKTAVGIELAQHLNGEIVNLDSRQVYADFPIITAQPNAQELNCAKHHLYGFLPTQDKFSAGTYAQKVLQVINQIHSQKKLPILIGGTGLYFKTLLSGIADIPTVPKEITEFYQQRCEEIGSQNLHQELQAVDPEYAVKIHPNDKQRIMRALEVFSATGKTFSWWHENSKPKPMVQGSIFGLEVPLVDLRPRLDRRIDLMLASGAMEEASAALKHCPDKNAPGWSGIGCPECHAYLNAKISLETCIELWKANTRAYAKRQYTWFRAVPQMQWFSPQSVQAMLDAVQF